MADGPSRTVEAADDIAGETSSFPSFAVFGSADPVELLNLLSAKVESINLKQGISNALDTKLDAVQDPLADANVNNDVAAVNALGALINSVMAQAGNQITQDDADSLIADAQAIIELILSSG